MKGNHALWDINETVNLTSLLYLLKDLGKEVGRHEYGLDVGLRCLFLQFLYDRSDRQMERDLRFNIAYKWVCGFTAFEKTPDPSFFGRFRKQVSTQRIGKIFKAIVNKEKEKQLVRGVFHFSDATSIITKNTSWSERDKAMSQ